MYSMRLAEKSGAQSERHNGGELPTCKFLDVRKLAKNLLVSCQKHSRPKMDNFGLKNPFGVKHSLKIKILSTRNSVCQKFVTFCQNSVGNLHVVSVIKLQISAPLTNETDDAIKCCC